MSIVISVTGEHLADIVDTLDDDEVPFTLILGAPDGEPTRVVANFTEPLEGMASVLLGACGGLDAALALLRRVEREERLENQASDTEGTA